MSGHCEQHCSPRCQGSVSVDMTWHMADAWVRWGPERQCPMCEGSTAERARIVEAIEGERREYGPSESLTPNGQGYVLALDLAAAIARGDA